MLGRKKKSAHRPMPRPRLEALEARECPVTFTWNPSLGAGTSVWETPLNWSNDGGLNDYPGGSGRTTDAVAFNGTTDNTRGAVMAGTGGAGYTLSSLQFKNGFTMSLTMRFPLILTGDSQMTSNAHIYASNAGATLTQQGGTFTWSSGGIADSTTQSAKSTFAIAANANLVVDTTTQVILGSNLTVNWVAVLENTGAFYLYNQATITNNGTIEIQVDSISGISKYGLNDPSVTITNNGTISKTAGGDRYTIDEPVLNQTGGDIQVHTGSLTFWGHTTATREVSIYEADGELQLWNTSAIYAEDGYQIEEGGVRCIGYGFGCTLSASIDGDFTMEGGAVIADSTDMPSDYGTLTLDVRRVYWNDGSIDETYNTNNNTPTQVVLSANVLGMTIGPTAGGSGPSILLTEFGGGAAPNSIDVIVSNGGNITDQSDPAPAGWTGAVTGGGKKYTITQPGAAPGGAGDLQLARNETAPGAATTGEVLAADLYFAYGHYKRRLSDDPRDGGQDVATSGWLVS
jgi:hypothetical protein